MGKKKENEKTYFILSLRRSHINYICMYVDNSLVENCLKFLHPITSEALLAILCIKITISVIAALDLPDS